MNKEPKTQGKIEEQIKKEILFLSDHWTEDERMPFNFGGWLDEVVTDIYKIYLKEQLALLQRVIELIGEMMVPFDEKYHENINLQIKNAELAKVLKAVTQLKTKISQMEEEIE